MRYEWQRVGSTVRARHELIERGNGASDAREVGHEGLNGPYEVVGHNDGCFELMFEHSALCVLLGAQGTRADG